MSLDTIQPRNSVIFYFKTQAVVRKNRQYGAVEPTCFEAELGIVALLHGQLPLGVESVVAVVVGRCAAVVTRDVARAVDAVAGRRRRRRTSVKRSSSVISCSDQCLDQTDAYQQRQNKQLHFRHLR